MTVLSVCRAGVVERVTLLKDAITQHPTGKAFIQFQAVAQAAAAISLTGSTLLQRAVTVTPKPVPNAHAASYVSGQMPQPSFAPPLQSFSPRFGSGDSWQSQGSRGQSYSRGRGVRGPTALLKSKSNVYVRPGLAK